MKTFRLVLAWFAGHGFPGPLCLYYRASLYADGTLSIERRYRFRWQTLHVVGPRAWLWRGKIQARFPDAGQAFEAIQTANAGEFGYRRANKLVKRYAMNAGQERPDSVSVPDLPGVPEPGAIPGKNGA